MKSIRWFTLLALTVVAPSPLLADRTVSSDFTQDGGTFVISPAGNLIVSHATNNPLLTLTDAANTSGITNVFVGTLNGEEGQVLVERESILTNSGFNVLGLHKGSTGTVTVTGANSQWQTSKGIDVGYSGTGTLNVENGGSVYTNGDAFFGSFDGGHGSAIISGTGSKWQITDWLKIGAGGTGALTIENGGRVTSGICDLPDGTVTITGPGSAWQSRDLWIRKNGVLNVNNSGVVEVTTYFRSDGTIRGNGGTISGNIVNWSGGLIAFGDSTGVLTIDGDLTNYGTLKFGIAGAASSLFNQLIVTGDLSLGGGGVEIDLLDGFTPTAHSEFKLIDASNFNRPEIVLPVTFDFTHAALGAGLSWDTSTFAVDGTIRVVPEASSLVLAGVGILAGLVYWRTKKPITITEQSIAVTCDAPLIPRQHDRRATHRFLVKPRPFLGFLIA